MFVSQAGLPRFFAELAYRQPAVALLHTAADICTSGAFSPCTGSRYRDQSKGVCMGALTVLCALKLGIRAGDAGLQVIDIDEPEGHCCAAKLSLNWPVLFYTKHYPVIGDCAQAL